MGASSSREGGMNFILCDFWRHLTMNRAGTYYLKGEDTPKEGRSRSILPRIATLLP